MNKNEDLPSEESTQRSKILDSAIKVFSRKGVDGSRLREIADHADVNHAMIKYYFGGKEALWREAVNFLFERQRRELNPEQIFKSTDTDPETTLRRFCEYLIRYWAKYPEHGRLVLQASLSAGPRLDWIAEQTRKTHTQFKELFEPNNTNEPFDVPAIAVLYIIIGACQSVFLLENEVMALYGVDVTNETFIEQFINLASNALATGLSPQALERESARISLKSREVGDGLELTIRIPKPTKG